MLPNNISKYTTSLNGMAELKSKSLPMVDPSGVKIWIFQW